MGGAQAGTSSPQDLTPGASWPGLGWQSAPAKVKGVPKTTFTSDTNCRIRGFPRLHSARQFTGRTQESLKTIIRSRGLLQ